MLPGRTALRPVASDPCRARPRRARVPGPSTSRLASRRHFLFRASADDARPVPGGDATTRPAAASRSSPAPGRRAPQASGETARTPLGTPRGRAGCVVPPGLRLPDGPRGGQNRHSGAPRVHGDCCWEGERGARSDEGGEGRRGGGPRLRQARPGRHPEPRRPPARASRSVPGSSASPTGIYSCLNICVDFFFLKKNQTQLFKHFKHRI